MSMPYVDDATLAGLAQESRVDRDEGSAAEAGTRTRGGSDQHHHEEREAGEVSGHTTLSSSRRAGDDAGVSAPVRF